VVDLSNFFFQLALHPSAGRWIRIKTEMGDFQWKALTLGLHCSRYWAGRLARVVQKTLSHQGVHLIWYVDDILILGDSQKSVSTNLEIFLQTCHEAGLIVTKKKSQLTTSQKVNHVGQQINLRTRMLEPQPVKLSRGLEMTKAYLRRSKSSPAHIVCVAGTLLDLQKGKCGTAWPGEVHHEGICLDVAWMSGVEGLRPVLSETGRLLMEALEALKHPMPRRIPQTSNRVQHSNRVSPPPSHTIR